MDRGFDRNAFLYPDTSGMDREYMRNIAKANNAIDFSKHNDWIRSVPENIEFARQQQWITSEYGKYDGPVLVCGSGPSLSDNIELVRQWKDAGEYLVAVDRAVKTLHENGIYPDLIVTADTQKTVRRFFEDVELMGSQKIAVHLALHPDVIDVFKKSSAQLRFYFPMNTWSFLCQKMYQDYGEEIACVEPGYVVTYSAVQIAYWMGFNRIVTIGNDLCYKTTMDAFFDVLGHPEDVCEVEGKTTILGFRLARNVFGLFPARYKDCSFIDCSGGLDKHGWEKRELEKTMPMSALKAGLKIEQEKSLAEELL